MKFKLILILILLAAIALTAFFLLKPENLNIQNLVHFTSKSKQSAHESDTAKSSSERLERQLMERLHKLEVTTPNIKRVILKQDSAVEIRASIPRGKPMEWVVWAVTSNLEETGYILDDCFYESDEKGCRIQFRHPERGNPLIQLVLLRSALYFSHTAKMAIFIEDFGFQADQTTVEYLSFTEPLTVGLIPEKKLTLWTAQIANEYKKEIVLMLPMEPVPSKDSKQAGAIIMVHYPEEKINQIIDDAMEKIPQFSGITNFYGSRILADSRVMTLVLNKASSKNAYFLYDHQSRASSVSAVAKKENVLYKSINEHVDTNCTVTELQDSLRRYAMIAQKTGDVIISSKPTAAFIKALQNELTVLKQNGIKLVYISEIINNEQTK